MLSALLAFVPFVGWPVAAYIYVRIQRHRSTSVAVGSAFFVLLIALYVGITLGDAYFALHHVEPSSFRTKLLLVLMIVWFGLPYVAVCIWLIFRFFKARDAATRNI